MHVLDKNLHNINVRRKAHPPIAMIENAKISIIHGGFYHCTPKWNRSRESYKFDKNFAFFLPATGEATIETTAGEFELVAGNLYFIPGHHLVSQVCEKQMSVYWIAFVSESYYLHHRLMGIQSATAWPLESLQWVAGVFRRFVDFFEDAETDDSRLRQDPPAGLSIQIEGTLMHLVGMLIESTEVDFRWGDDADLERLRPAIDFMDEHYLRNPSLAEIAGQIRLAPNYFHRFFKREAGTTPFKYMENRRLDLARKLLFDRRLNITEVAQRSGYASLYYFSRAFRQRFGCSPSGIRRAP